MKTIAVTGASGLIGKELCAELAERGYRAVSLRRVSLDEGTGWNSGTGAIRLPDDERADAVFHLAGEPVAGLWSAAKKRAIEESRVGATERLAKFLAALPSPPEALICASAIGLYGDRGDELLDENSAAGSGFLANVVTGWEDACRPAAEAGMRVAQARFGVVISRKGGALAASLPAFKLGLGAALGSGRQWQSWISLEDTVRALLHVLDGGISGPVNIVSPQAVTNAEFTQALAAELHRAAFLKIPAFALRAVLGQAADEMLLSSAHVVPGVLQASGFAWRQRTIEEAFEFELQTGR